MKTFESFMNEQTPTDEMKAHFDKRTNMHIGLVRKYIKKIDELEEYDFAGLLDRMKIHDNSKFKFPEYEPYVFTTWSYYAKDHNIPFKVPETIKEEMDTATIHHITTNRHHPEFHTTQRDNLLNSNNRDAPTGTLVDATAMSDTDIAEMVADWCAVSEERGNTPKEWADKNLGVRWEFNEGQLKLIYNLIDKVF